MKILSLLRFLARQALPLRGHDDDRDGNLLQIMRLRGEEDSEILEWLDRKSSRYLSPEMQNDLIKTKAAHGLRQLRLKLLQSQFISIMIDETTDITNKEQVTIVFRSVIENLTHFNLSNHKLRGQSYNWCTIMSGQHSGSK